MEIRNKVATVPGFFGFFTTHFENTIIASCKSNLNLMNPIFNVYDIIKYDKSI